MLIERMREVVETGDREGQAGGEENLGKGSGESGGNGSWRCLGK